MTPVPTKRFEKVAGGLCGRRAESKRGRFGEHAAVQAVATAFCTPPARR